VTPTGVALYLRVTPNAGRDVIGGAENRDDGTTCLRVHVSAVPDKGKANAAVIELLAKKLKLPKSAFKVTAGESSRCKTIAVATSSQDVTAHLQILTK
jgi:uncharacterized protein (TIGR00251 family)